MNVYIENIEFWNHIVYTFETMIRCLHLKGICYKKANTYSDDEKVVYYGRQIPQTFKGVFIREGSLWGENYLTEKCIPILPLKRFNNIPVLFMDSSWDIPCIIRKEDYYEINFDIVQSSFFILTGCEEIINRKIEFDSHSRYYVENRILYKESFLDRPLVNIYASFLRECLVQQRFLLEKAEMYESYACISHDVDYPYKRYKMEKVLSKLFHKSMEKRIDDGCKMIIQTEKKYGIHSSWYFMAGGNNPGYDLYYELQNEAVQRLIQSIRQKGDEVNWHYSYNAAFDRIQFQKEYNHFVESVDVKTLSGRCHFLRYMIPETWRMFSAMKMHYDTTLASAQHEGFIYGICTPFHLFDAIKGENLSVWEIPLIVMDGTVCTKQYRGLTPEEVIDKVTNLITEVKKYNGVFSILWHNTSLRRSGWYEWEAVYMKLMELLKENFVCETGESVIRIYEKI